MKSLIAFRRLFESQLLTVPYIEASDTRDFLFHFNRKMDKYLVKIKSISQESLGNYRRSAFRETIEKVVCGLKSAMDNYLHGYPSSGYQIFSRMVEDTKLQSSLINFRTIKIDSYHSFYRMKKEHNKIGLKGLGYKNGFGVIRPTELFHLPFEIRRNIPSNRFSVSGFPSLYLSENLETCYSECGFSTSDSFHSVCFLNHRPLYFVDLVPITYLANSGLNIADTYESFYEKDVFIDYARVFPIILACHAKIQYNQRFNGEVVYFKSEYIVPQILTEWYRENRILVDGIRFLSCAVDNVHKTSNSFNYVIPVLNIDDSGLCKSLLKYFSSTEVYSHLDGKLKYGVSSIEKRLKSSKISILKST